MSLSKEDVRYLTDHKGRVMMRFWLVVLVGIFASWVWLVALFSLFAFSEFWKMQRILRLPTEEDGSSSAHEIGRSIGQALVATISAYIPVFILGSLLKLLKDYVMTFFK